MVYSSQFNPFRLTAEEAGGQPSYMDALQKVFSNTQQAYKTAYTPRSMAEELLKQTMANKINAPKAADAQGWYDLEKAYKQAQIDQANRGDQLTGEIPQLFALRSQFDPDSDEFKTITQAINTKAMGGSGTTVFDPTTGAPLVQIGGSSSGRSAGGGTFLNPTTGQITSAPTSSQVTNLQGRVVGQQAVEPYINRIATTLPQFQNPDKAMSLLAQKVSNAVLGTDYPLPSEEASGKAALKEASEGLLKSFGLNATGANRHAMEVILTPKFGESEKRYRARVIEQAQAYAQNANLAKQALGAGINVTSSNMPRPQNSAQRLPPVPKGKVRVYFPDGPHIIPEKLLSEAIRSGATLNKELPDA